jgi:hypothetical protein
MAPEFWFTFAWQVDLPIETPIIWLATLLFEMTPPSIKISTKLNDIFLMTRVSPIQQIHWTTLLPNSPVST